MRKKNDLSAPNKQLNRVLRSALTIATFFERTISCDKLPKTIFFNFIQYFSATNSRISFTLMLQLTLHSNQQFLSLAIQHFI